MPSDLRRQKDQERKLRTREALLDAAQQAFIAQGFHKTVISDVVSRAGVGQGTFYRHFAGKPAVFEALLDRLTEDLLKVFEPMSTQLPSNLDEYRDASYKAISHMAAFIDQHRDVIFMLLTEAPAIGGNLERRLQILYDQFAQLAQFYLDHAIANGFARPCRSDVISQALVGIALRLATLLGRDTDNELDVEAVAEEIVTFAFFGFAPTADVPTAPVPTPYS